MSTASNAIEQWTRKVPKSVISAASVNTRQLTGRSSASDATTSTDTDGKSGTVSDEDAPAEMDITIEYIPSDGCVVLYGKNTAGPAWFIKRLPKLDMHCKEVRLTKGRIPKPHTTSVFKFARIKSDLNSDTFYARAQQAASGTLLEMEIDLPVPDFASRGSEEAILEDYKAIDEYLANVWDIVWWVPVEDELQGGDQQRHMLAYALATCPMCNWPTAHGIVPEPY